MRQYIGSRYVPKFMGTYDASQEYEVLCVVDNGLGTSYISKGPVPAGTPLTNTACWAIYGAAGGAIINLQNQIDVIDNNIIFPENFGAVGDGVTDDTAAINSAIANGGYILFKKGSTYLVDAEVNIKVKSNTILNLNGATIQAIPNSNDYSEVIMVDGVSEVIIENGTIIGERDGHTGLTGEWGMGISLDNNPSENITIRNMDISKCWGDSIYIGGNSKNITIENCTLHDSRRQGISVVYAEDVKICHNIIYDISGTAPESAIDVEPNNGQIAKNVIISDNILNDCPHLIAVVAGPNLDRVENVKISDNICVAANSTEDLVRINAVGVEFSDNFISGISTNDIMRIIGDENIVKGNSIYDSQCARIIYVPTSHHNIISDNIISNVDTSSVAVYFNQSDENIFKNNVIDTVTTPNNEYLLYFTASSNTCNDNVIDNNTIVNVTTQYLTALGANASRNVHKFNTISGTYEYIGYKRSAGSGDNSFYFNVLKSGTTGNFDGSGGYNATNLQNIIDGILT